MGRTKKVKSPETSAAPVVIPSDLTDLITQWHAAKQQLDTAKELENTLRQAIVASTFDGTKLEGTDRVEVGWGYELKLTRVLAYNATNENKETEQVLALIANNHDEGLAAALVKWTPEISKKAYRAAAVLAESHPALKEAMARAFTIKPGMPQLELVPAKTDAAPIVVEDIPA